MLREAMYTTINTLWRKGHNKSEISRLTGHDWKTVNKVINAIEAGKTVPVKKPHYRIIEPYTQEIVSWLEIKLSAVRIHEELVRAGVSVGYSTIKDYIALIKKDTNIFVRIHTEPGEEAQVDFGYVGYTIDNNGKRRKTWVFNMRLSHSRLDFYKKVYIKRLRLLFFVILKHLSILKVFQRESKLIT